MFQYLQKLLTLQSYDTVMTGTILAAIGVLTVGAYTFANKLHVENESRKHNAETIDKPSHVEKRKKKDKYVFGESYRDFIYGYDY